MSERTGKAPDGTAFLLAGPEDARPVVLIHGLGLCRQLWDAHLPGLATRYRVIAYDLYGHGESAPPPATASLTVYAQQIADLLDHLSIARATLVGFSIGGMINRRFALDHPDRLAALAILNSPHDRGSEAQAQVEARAAFVRPTAPWRRWMRRWSGGSRRTFALPALKRWPQSEPGARRWIRRVTRRQPGCWPTGCAS
ncbi:MAG: alpha/beta fold hydrolase [Pseudomonadota bacterium]